jgi:hypothetical protein
MKKNNVVSECRRVRWRGRAGWLVANDRLALCWLSGGGHLASFSQRRGRVPDLNLVWEAPWKTIEPQRYSEKRDAPRYGRGPVGRTLSGYTGHMVCVDYFGAPSKEEELSGLPLHGELGCSRWTLAKKSVRDGLLRLSMRGAAASAGLAMLREITLRENESVVCVSETLANKRNRDAYFQWVQHATFGPPFLRAGESVCVLPGTRSKTSPHGYEGSGALQDGREFLWPMAPAIDGGALDISQPFNQEGRGFVATSLLGGDRGSTFTYVAVLNWRLGLLAGYVFRRSEFPWAAIWEENCARSAEPWRGKVQARGLEFGNSPLPFGLKDAILAGPLFGVPGIGCLPARGKQRASYAMFVAEVPETWRAISGITVHGKTIVISGPGTQDRVELPASGLAELWPAVEKTSKSRAGS